MIKLEKSTKTQKILNLGSRLGRQEESLANPPPLAMPDVHANLQDNTLVDCWYQLINI